MSAVLRSTRSRSLGANLAVFVGAPLLLNGLIFGLGWNRPRAKAAGIPPGWVVGSLWLLLFAGMGAARWELASATSLFRDRRTEWISLLAFLCLLYPLYTEGLRDDRIGLGGNIVTAVTAFAALGRVSQRSASAGILVLPTCVWLTYAAFATARAIRQGRV